MQWVQDVRHVLRNLKASGFASPATCTPARHEAMVLRKQTPKEWVGNLVLFELALPGLSILRVSSDAC